MSQYSEKVKETLKRILTRIGYTNSQYGPLNSWQVP